MARVISKKRIALIGGNTVIGSALLALCESHYIINHTEVIPWDKPAKAIQMLSRGHPDVFICCYSRLDDCDSHLLGVARVLATLANQTNAFIIGFVDTRVFGDDQSDLCDESTQPRPSCIGGELQLAYEMALAKAKYATILRIGEFVSQQAGCITSLLKRVMIDKLTEIDELKQFSITTGDLLVKGVARAIEYEMVGTYHLAHTGELTERILWKYIAEYCKKQQIRLPRVTYGGYQQSYRVLNNLKWICYSMTDVQNWQTALIPYVTVVETLYGHECKISDSSSKSGSSCNKVT